MARKTVCVNEPTHRALSALSFLEGRTIGEVVAEAVQAYGLSKKRLSPERAATFELMLQNSKIEWSDLIGGDDGK